MKHYDESYQAMANIANQYGQATSTPSSLLTRDDIRPFPVNAVMQIEDYALQTHINNLISTFGSDKVKSFMKWFESGQETE
jgi:hypothetical protein